MAKKIKECDSYTLTALRNAAKALDDIREEINAGGMAEAVKILTQRGILTQGGEYDITHLSGLFRAFDRIEERFDSAVNSYYLHQERHECGIPEDIDAIL